MGHRHLATFNRLAEHTDTVTDLAWNKDSSRLTSASLDNTIIIWDTASWQPLTTLTSPTDEARYMALNVDGSLIAFSTCGNYDPKSIGNCTRDEILIWDTNRGQPLKTLADHTDTVLNSAWNDDGSKLASASSDRTIIIWDTATWQPQITLIDHTDTVLDVAWNGDSSRLASTSSDKTIIIWDTTTWQPLVTLTDDRSVAEFVIWNNDGTRLASGSCGKTDGDSNVCIQGEITIWDTTNREPLTTLVNHRDSVNSVTWNASSDRLASAGAGQQHHYMGHNQMATTSYTHRPL
ncbi:MAG: WD40 repeat domain-containing protein [Chloroflexi bacterium]|nr:WD40 repeat domain-containing protein [Chloroflexota bacterium]